MRLIWMRQVVLVVLMNLVKLMNESSWGLVAISVYFVLVMLSRVMEVMKLLDCEEVGKILVCFVPSSGGAVVSMMISLREICFFSVTSGIYFSSLGLRLMMKVTFVASLIVSWGSFSL